MRVRTVVGRQIWKALIAEPSKAEWLVTVVGILSGGAVLTTFLYTDQITSLMYYKWLAIMCGLFLMAFILERLVGLLCEREK